MWQQQKYPPTHEARQQSSQPPLQPPFLPNGPHGASFPQGGPFIRQPFQPTQPRMQAQQLFPIQLEASNNRHAQQVPNQKRGHTAPEIDISALQVQVAGFQLGESHKKGPVQFEALDIELDSVGAVPKLKTQHEKLANVFELDKSDVAGKQSGANFLEKVSKVNLGPSRKFPASGLRAPNFGAPPRRVETNGSAQPKGEQQNKSERRVKDELEGKRDGRTLDQRRQRSPRSRRSRSPERRPPPSRRSSPRSQRRSPDSRGHRRSPSRKSRHELARGSRSPDSRRRPSPGRSKVAREERHTIAPPGAQSSGGELTKASRWGPLSSQKPGTALNVTELDENAIAAEIDTQECEPKTYQPLQPLQAGLRYSISPSPESGGDELHEEQQGDVGDASDKHLFGNTMRRMRDEVQHVGQGPSKAPNSLNQVKRPGAGPLHGSQGQHAVASWDDRSLKIDFLKAEKATAGVGLGGADDLQLDIEVAGTGPGDGDVLAARKWGAGQQAKPLPGDRRDESGRGREGKDAQVERFYRRARDTRDRPGSVLLGEHGREGQRADGRRRVDVKSEHAQGHADGLHAVQRQLHQDGEPHRRVKSPADGWAGGDELGIEVETVGEHKRNDGWNVSGIELLKPVPDRNPAPASTALQSWGGPRSAHSPERRGHWSTDGRPQHIQDHKSKALASQGQQWYTESGLQMASRPPLRERQLRDWDDKLTLTELQDDPKPIPPYFAKQQHPPSSKVPEPQSVPRHEQTLAPKAPLREEVDRQPIDSSRPLRPLQAPTKPQPKPQPQPVGQEDQFEQAYLQHQRRSTWRSSWRPGQELRDSRGGVDSMPMQVPGQTLQRKGQWGAPAAGDGEGRKERAMTLVRADGQRRVLGPEEEALRDREGDEDEGEEEEEEDSEESDEDQEEDSSEVPQVPVEVLLQSMMYHHQQFDGCPLPDFRFKIKGAESKPALSLSFSKAKARALEAKKESDKVGEGDAHSQEKGDSGEDESKPPPSPTDTRAKVLAVSMTPRGVQGYLSPQDEAERSSWAAIGHFGDSPPPDMLSLESVKRINSPDTLSICGPTYDVVLANYQAKQQQRAAQGPSVQQHALPVQQHALPVQQQAQRIVGSGIVVQPASVPTMAAQPIRKDVAGSGPGSVSLPTSTYKQELASRKRQLPPQADVAPQQVGMKKLRGSEPVPAQQPVVQYVLQDGRLTQLTPVNAPTPQLIAAKPPFVSAMMRPAQVAPQVVAAPVAAGQAELSLQSAQNILQQLQVGQVVDDSVAKILQQQGIPIYQGGERPKSKEQPTQQAKVPMNSSSGAQQAAPGKGSQDVLTLKAQGRAQAATLAPPVPVAVPGNQQGGGKKSQGSQPQSLFSMYASSQAPTVVHQAPEKPPTQQFGQGGDRAMQEDYAPGGSAQAAWKGRSMVEMQQELQKSINVHGGPKPMFNQEQAQHPTKSPGVHQAPAAQRAPRSQQAPTAGHQAPFAGHYAPTAGHQAPAEQATGGIQIVVKPPPHKAGPIQIIGPGGGRTATLAYGSEAPTQPPLPPTPQRAASPQPPLPPPQHQAQPPTETHYGVTQQQGWAHMRGADVGSGQQYSTAAAPDAQGHHVQQGQVAGHESYTGGQSGQNGQQQAIGGQGQTQQQWYASGGEQWGQQVGYGSAWQQGEGWPMGQGQWGQYGQ